MIAPDNAVLNKMLDRLFAAMVNGPSMNCRPHASRQRIDLAHLKRLDDGEAGAALLKLLGDDAKASVVARVPAPARSNARPRTVVLEDDAEAERDADAEAEDEAEDDPLTPAERAAQQAWNEQQALLTKLRVIADDARTYEQDTGVHALNVGFPILSLPPGSFGGSGRGGLATRRVLAPIAFVPAILTVKTGTRQTVEIVCHGEGVDRAIPNVALLAWLEQQTGQDVGELFPDETGEEPWKEIVAIVRAVARCTGLPVPAMFELERPPETIELVATPRADEGDARGKSIVSSAVLGLFPTSNQGLLRDTREMIAQGAPNGPIESFVKLQVDAASSLQAADAPAPVLATPRGLVKRQFDHERFVTRADPCQARAVRRAGESPVLVVHGPPGTGKSQTITNIIGDHLARGERVLFVCDKRTALDVVADRLEAIGLGSFCATVHDPQRDQREFYRSVREQLDGLVEAPTYPKSGEKLAKVDEELQSLHDDLTRYHRELMGDDGIGGPGSFHHLVGQWLAEIGEVGHVIDEKPLQHVQPAEFDRHASRLREVLERGEAVDHARNPWTRAAGIDLATFLGTPMDAYRRATEACCGAADQADATVNTYLPSFGQDADVVAEAETWRSVGGELRALAKLSDASAARWARETLKSVNDAKSQLESARDWIAQIQSQPLDAQLRAAAGERSADQIASQRKAMEEYLSDFARLAGHFLVVRTSVPDVDDTVTLKWLAADSKSVVTARKRLDAAAPLAAAVEGVSLDASLLARYAAAPLDVARRIEWLAAINAYLDVARKWYAFLHFSRKKAAEPVVRHFGLSLNAESAEIVRAFLTGVQQRFDLRATVAGATGESFDESSDDEALLIAYRQHRGTVTALSSTAPSTLGEGAIGDELAERLHAIIGTSAGAARSALAKFGLPLSMANAQRLAAFERGAESRARVVELLNRSIAGSPLPALPADEDITTTFDQHARLLELLSRIPAGSALSKTVSRALAEPGVRQAIIDALLAAPRRAAAIVAMEKEVDQATLFGGEWRSTLKRDTRAGALAGPTLRPLADRLDTLEGVLRIAAGLRELPRTLSDAASLLLAGSRTAADGFSAVRRNVLAGEITRRLQANPNLQQVDGHRLQIAFDRFKSLSEKKRGLVLESIQNVWISKQKERLLAGTGSRLNGVGADLKRRLTLRGQRAMRLRQVIAHGCSIEGGDPLFDLRPVWMASPETVAQLFAREPIFDVVVFDEASQCRLEEALPVLTRARRVVIAGDPKQLPPTRFFESAVATSENEDAQTDQELFEVTQGDVEDLLMASLNLQVDESYLDVHYRSRNGDLIGFSNEHFYNSRLQAIPAHPKNRTRHAPITLYRVDGVYEKRQNVAEAEAVCKVVRDLLKRAKPPSIGIACFNLVQRDLIVETLEEMAEEDSEFADRLAAARERRGAGQSEALFVKNLENVQGDERDHLIISTTYGPDKAGKFRRNFGPLGSAGGGRRLNVLVTRAREELHVVTSIPRAAYASLPAIPPGQSPGGAWLLFAYLAFAEQLQGDYETAHRILENAQPEQRASVNARPSRTPSQFARALAAQLAQQHNVGSEVHWGNDGFCVDVATQHPTRAEDVTLGVLCDTTRYAAADDPVEWDVFRTSVHESQGWKLQRVWTPHFFRDPGGITSAIARAASATE